MAEPAKPAKEKVKEVMVMRGAELEDRPSDLPVPPDLYQNISLFAQLKVKPGLDRYPGTTVIRRYEPGEVICRQGEPGWTAFYILTSRDVEELYRQLNSPDAWDWKDRADKLDKAGDQADRTMVTVFLAVPPDARRKASGVTQKMRAPNRPMPRMLSIDAPVDIDAMTCLAKLKEGDLFGEMSCLNRTPRSATVIAHERCLVLEMLQNIFEAVLKDANYKQKNDEITRKRAIEQMLERLPLFNDLDKDMVALIRKEAQLKSYKSGAIVCDEHDRSDDMFVIHRGLVQALKGASALVALEDVTDWNAFAGRLTPDPAGEALWAALPPVAQAHIDCERPRDREVVVEALNKLITGASLWTTPAFAGPAADKAVAAEVAKLPAEVSDADLRRVNRLVLQTALPGLLKPFAPPAPAKPGLPAPKAAPAGPELKADDVPDWPKLGLRLGAVPALKALRAALPAAVQPFLKADQPNDRQEVVYAINDAIKGPPLHAKPEFAGVAWGPLVARELEAAPDKPAEWSERTKRRVNRAIVQSALDGLKPFKPDVGPDTTLAYRAKGELIGEMGVNFKKPRSATCVAFIHSRSEEGERVAGNVSEEELIDLLYLPASLFHKLREDPGFKAKIEAEARARRKTDIDILYNPVTELGRPAQTSEKFRELGLVQGQRLMLIDLERCTRCDECVKACVATHEDGRSRLFLDGPRFGKYLVPTTCRSCLDPVCMIPCPVGSIRRGDNNQIVIEDWCIGCQACADQCPYGSIQMGDIGVIPEGAAGWLVAPLAAADADPAQVSKWTPRQAPLTIDRDHPAAPAFACKYEFMFDPTRLESAVNEDGTPKAAREFTIEVLAPEGSTIAVWLNGTAVELEEKKRKPVKKMMLGRELNLRFERHIFPIPEPVKAFKPGRNAVLARAVSPAKYRGEFFDLRCDEVRKPEAAKLAAIEYVEKGVTQQAVVCDLCTDLPGQKPACVHACPHDAAMRVDARVNFPTR